MSIFFVNTQDAQISNAFIATLGAAPGSTYLAQVKAFGLIPAAQAMIAATGATTAAALTTRIVTNLGLTGIAADGGTSYLNTVTFAGASSTWGSKLMETLNLFTGLANDPIYGAAASSYLARVNSAVSYSSVAANNSTDLSTLAAAVGSAGSTGTGSTFTLTTNVDNFPGTSGNDTFNALGDSGSATFSAADIISGGTGTDTLNVTFTAAAADATLSALISGIEIANVRATAAAANSSETVLAASKISGMTNFNAVLSTNAVKVTDLATGAQVGIVGNSSVVNGGLNFASKTATNAVTINLSNGVSQTAAVAAANGGTNVGLGIFNASSGATTATINSTGASNTTGGIQLSGSASITALTINAASALTVTDGADTADIIGFGGTEAKITVAGAATNIAATSSAAVKGAVGLGTIEETTVKTIDASGLTAGGIEAVLNSNVAVAVTGGKGADIITTGATLTTGSVAAGDGVDTLVVGAAAHIALATTGAKYTGFEVLRIGDFSFDTSVVDGITALELIATTGARTHTNISAAQAASVTVQGTQHTGLVLTLKDATGSADAVTLNLSNPTVATNVDVPGLSIIGVETLNIKATSGTAGTQSDVAFASGGANKLKSVNITGAAETTLSATNTALAMTVDATAATGKFTASGDFIKASNIKGSSTAVNTFTVGGTADTGSTYTGGSGKDVFNATVAQLAADNTLDTVLSGGAGSDTLKITGGVTAMTDNHFTNVTGMETLTLDGTAAVSLTGAGAAFKASFADGVTITSGVLVNGATYNVGLGLYHKDATLTLATAADADLASTADNITIATGSGNDTVTVTTAAVGAVGAAGQILVTTGAGNDTISVTTGTLKAVTGNAPVIVDGGAGKDAITLAGVNAGSGLTVTVKVKAGESTLTDYDSVTGFDMATAALFSSTLDFDNFSVQAFAATAATGFTAAELTVAVAATTGLVTFTGSSAAAATLAQKAAAVASVVVTANGNTALFTHGTNAYVFNNDAAGDSLVELVGQSAATAILSAGNATTDNGIFVS